MAREDLDLAGREFAWAADRVFDGRHVLISHAVVVRGRTIVAVLPTEAVPAGVPIRYEPGTTLLPGLIDMHTHLMRWEAPLFVAYGVTTIRDVGNEMGWILAQRDEAHDYGIPRILCVGPLLDGPRPNHPLVARACVSLEDAVAAVGETARAGADGIKLYVGLAREWLAPMVAEAHAHGLKASIHCQGTGVLAAADAGVDEFHHLDGLLEDLWPGHPLGWLELWGLPEFVRTAAAQERVADCIAAAGMAATPTLAYWQSQWRARSDDFDPVTEAPHMPEEVVSWQRARRVYSGEAEQWRRALEAAQRFTGLLLERGVRIFAGADAPCGAQTPGLSLWHELALLQEAGMSAVQALRAATSEAAAYLGRPDLGRLAAGAVADLVVVRGDPTASVPHTPEVVGVLQDGEVQQLEALVAQAAELAPTVGDDPWGKQFRAHSEKL